MADFFAGDVHGRKNEMYSTFYNAPEVATSGRGLTVGGKPFRTDTTNPTQRKFRSRLGDGGPTRSRTPATFNDSQIGKILNDAQSQISSGQMTQQLIINK